jgi:Mg/Co/Ni transporter MgtE
VPTCALDDDLAAVRKRVQATGFETCIVIDDQRIVLGRLGRAAIHSDEPVSVEQAMREGPSTVRPSLPLRELLGRMAQRNQTTALVTTLDGQLVGLVRREEAQRVLTA